jgi:hypothetical protein
MRWLENAYNDLRELNMKKWRQMLSNEKEWAGRKESKGS